MIDLMLAALLLQNVSPCDAVERAGPPPADCPRWESWTQTAPADLFFDPASVRREGTGFEITTRTVYVAWREDGVRSARTRYRYDCAQRTVATTWLTTFDASGTELTAGAPGGANPPARRVLARMAADRLLTRFCPG